MSENLFGLTVATDKGLDDLQCQCSYSSVDVTILGRHGRNNCWFAALILLMHESKTSVTFISGLGIFIVFALILIF